ncbi:DUF4293 domain-containing protein [uncultured Sanguibacteroides sp.]|uniref:DUF4293 domain-containing protein n=1 Tax=uncultured Sanguibacteroides sp. TaxID=1635151 RepID=UPI0025EF8D98|nr:DUF4293 domain-containing protein [uncultured Sanguibacteroides sp.]
MIQRIQSIYLFVIGILMVLPLCVPIARIVVPNDTNYDFFAYGIVEKSTEVSFVSYYWALLILSLFTILLPLITIFLYKKRFLQLRLCIVEIILLIGSAILMWYHIRQFGSDATVLYKFSFILPVVCIIFTYMAIRGIVKDIKLLRSYDRIR